MYLNANWRHLMIKDSTKITWYLDKKLAQEVRSLAKKDRRTLSIYITLLVENSIKNREFTDYTEDKNNSLIDNDNISTPYCLKNKDKDNIYSKNKEIDYKEKRKFNFDHLPKCISEDIAKDFIDHRRLLKKPMKQSTFDRQMQKASKIHDGINDLTANDAILKTIDFGWLSIEEKWLLRINSPSERGKGYGKQDDIDFHKWKEDDELVSDSVSKSDE